MLNYANLNDVEFESLCQDIMQRMLGTELRRFALGRDGGIDLTDKIIAKNTVVQIKHYRKSSNSQLISSLKRELPKVEEIQPKEYYICCSSELSPDNIREIYSVFQPYMSSDKNIITLLEIDGFLKNPQNIDILRKHYKLWLDSTGILEDLLSNKLFVDCEVLLADLEEEKKLFVKSSLFDFALSQLEKRHSIIIVGNPGVGKTITSKMLVLHFAAHGYTVRYTTNTADLSLLKQSLSRNPEEKEIVLIDDCFGQAYFEMKGSQTTELHALIQYIKINPNKLLIMNSRITIFQSAKEKDFDLEKSLESRVVVINMDDLSEIEKAKILYNHLYFKGVPEEHYREIVQEKLYLDIVRHKNYCPRIIEYVCNRTDFDAYSPEEFCSLFMENLDNPREMWENEYVHNLQKADRLLILTVYSLTETYISFDLAKACFDRRIQNEPDIDKTINQFEYAFQRLDGSFIKMVDVRGEKCISLLNHSINDYIEAHLQNNKAEKEELIDSISAVEQMIRLFPKYDFLDHVKQTFNENTYSKLIFPNSQSKTNYIAWIVSECLIEMDVCRNDLVDYLKSSMNSFYLGDKQVYPDCIVLGLLSRPLLSYYGLEKEVLEPGVLENIFDSFLFDIDDTFRIIRDIDEVLEDQVDDEESKADRDQFISRAIDILTDYIDILCENINTDEYFEGSVNTIYYGLEEMDYGYVVSPSDVEYCIEEEIENNVRSALIHEIERLPKEYASLKEIAEKAYIFVSGAHDLVESFFADEYELEVYHAPVAKNSMSEIDYIFRMNRLLE